MTEELDESNVELDDDLGQEELEQNIEDVSNEPEEKQKAEEEDERQAYSRRVQKRIDKMHYKHQVELEKRDKEIEALKNKFIEFESSYQEQAHKQNTESLESKQKDLWARRKEALEIGDYDTLNEIDKDLLEIKVKQNAEPKSSRQESPPERQTDNQPAPVVNHALEAWQLKNQWVFDQKQTARLKKANDVFQEVLNDGFDIEEPETYDEIDKRLKRVLPPPTGAPDRGQVTSNTQGFTAEDKKLMREFGLNPNDAQARKLWIKNRG